MKARFTLFALGALIAGNAFAASPFSIYFNTEGSTSCYVSNVTNVNVLPDGNLLATTTGTPQLSNAAQCGVATAFTIGGSVSGQTGAFTLALTAGNQTVNVTSAATSYVFPTAEPTGTPYTVSVSAQPAGQTCTIQNASGTVGAVNVTNANVTCTTGTSYTIGGSVTGLSATGLVLAVTAGSQTVNVASGATSYKFPNAVATGTGYNVTVQTQPVGLNCSVSNATGTISGANVTNANVTCTPSTTLGSCTTGQAGDVPGYTATCSGTFKLQAGGVQTTKGPSAYSFQFVIGNNQNDWPGGPFGTSEIFSIGTTQFLSIPFKPSPGHTITVNEAQTYTPHPISMSVSTSMGLFNNAQKGNGVVCVQTGGQPSLILSSNGTSANCVLDPNTTYWLNIIPAYYQNGAWQTDYSGTAGLGITVYKQN